MLYFPKLNILNHGFYGLRDFTDVGGGVLEAWGSLQPGFCVRIYRIYRIIEDVFVSNLGVKCNWVTFCPSFRRCVDASSFPDRFHLI
jgi:hypothetical protein